MADTPRTTRDVTPADVADVVADPRRATLTFVDDGEPAIVPVRARRERDRWRFAAAAPALDDREVVLLLDDGDWWFELRGVSVRGVAAATATAGTPSSRGASSRGAMGASAFDASDARVRDFLDASTVVELATVSPSGRPFVTPLWFVGDDGALYVTTSATSRAARNVATHPAVAMLLHGDRDGRRDRVLLLRGSATVHHAFPSWRVLAKLALKYHVSPRGALSELRHAAQWPLRLLYYADGRGGPAHLRIVPTAAEIVPASPRGEVDRSA
ncbi:MAG TPA: pyridoxamine 5'-phosphate oxidase family protein [Caldimonas sp.]|nr:pyridoxamine 5'-phosphate oxidase family protein [Caldimonas sp.]